MKVIMWVFGVLLFVSSTNTKAQMLPVFRDLPVFWQSLEQWQWQGQSLTSQRFNSDQDVITIAQQVQQRLDTDLRIQRLATSWLLSFEQEHTHYLILLSAHEQGTQGWLSSLSLKEQFRPASIPHPPTIFLGLYQHSWSLKSAQSTSPAYFVLKPLEKEKTKINPMWSQLIHRLKRHRWRGSFCEKSSSWCHWEQASQKLMVWVDPNDGLWHVLWWPKFLGENK